jgi:hypothetical protein
MARRDLGGLNGVCMCECMCVCLSHQISTQLNTYGRFWSGAWDSVFHHHQQQNNDGISHGRMVTHPSNRIYAKVHWSCSGAQRPIKTLCWGFLYGYFLQFDCQMVVLCFCAIQIFSQLIDIHCTLKILSNNKTQLSIILSRSQFWRSLHEGRDYQGISGKALSS